MSGTARIEALGGRVSLHFRTAPLLIAAALTAALCAVTALSLMLGDYPLTLPEVWATLRGAAPSDTAQTVIWEFRAPRALVSAMAGALMGLSGAVLQAITRNPLADPSLVGVSQGASLAVVALIVAFPLAPPGLRPFVAFGGALAVAALIQIIALRRSGGSTLRFILTGIGVAAFLYALTSAILTYGQIERAQSALGWLAGSIHAAGWGDVAVLALASALTAPLLFAAARAIGALRMGADLALVQGLSVRRARPALITLSVALAAIPVSSVGPLGFVGLVAPHIAARLAHAGVGQHLALTAASGALMVALADFIGRTAFAPVQIPAGLLTAIFGAPLFVFLILRGQRAAQ